ncbi:UDP-glucuronosyltransferase 2A1 [Amia ocellicauda]|uniref:UDP-glucuronosyltransferase 2A1 n=1 Tax=Amia ocellicauda TaxID=2972642 RepID=UPI0034644693
MIETFTSRGHNATVLVSNATLLMDYTSFSTFSYEETMQYWLDEFFKFWIYGSEHMSYWQTFRTFMDMMSNDIKISLQICDGVLRSELLMEKLKESKFDLMLTDPIYPCSELVAEILGVPLVYSFRFLVANTMERHCGQIPAPPSYVPDAMGKLTDHMDFTDRLINMLFY